VRRLRRKKLNDYGEDANDNEKDDSDESDDGDDQMRVCLSHTYDIGFKLFLILQNKQNYARIIQLKKRAAYITHNTIAHMQLRSLRMRYDMIYYTLYIDIQYIKINNDNDNNVSKL
jgi:hypothetical protein